MRTIRPLDRFEAERLVLWAGQEGWNPAPGDGAAFYAADPDGFIGAFVEGQMVSGMAAVSYGKGFGFIGLYITLPSFRGQGHGRAVWDAGLARLGDRIIGLDGVPAQQGNYASMGFVKAYETIRYAGTLKLAVPSGVAVVAPAFDAVAAYDARCFPAPRADFLRPWLQAPRTARYLMRDGRLVGFGAIRACLVGHKIGPLFAETADDALALLAALAEGRDGEIQIDVPAQQAAFIRVLEGEGLTPGFATARMYRGGQPVVDQARVFGITTLELG